MASISTWTEADLRRFIENTVKSSPPSLPRSFSLSELRIVDRLIVTDRLELSPQSKSGGLIAATLQNSWVNYGSGYAGAGYRKLLSGLVVLEGLIKSGTATGGTVLFTLPVDYRPKEKHLFVIDVETADAYNATARIDVGSDGNISISRQSANGAAVNYLCLDGIAFYAE